MIGAWLWGDKKSPKVDSYCYLGVDFAFNRDIHINRVAIVKEEINLISPR